jgi:hypothetical protein
MRIEIKETSLLYYVRLSAQRDGFDELLVRFKDALPRKVRTFNPRDNYWTVAKRAQARLRKFCEQARAAGAQIDWRDEPTAERPDAPRPPRAINKERELSAPGYLVAGLEGDNSELIYRAAQKQQARATVILRKLPGWASVSATMGEYALRDSAKELIFYSLLEALMPGGRVRVSNRTISATKLSFNAAREFAGWLGLVMNNEKNKSDSNHGREYARLEGERRLDGSLRMIQGGGFSRGSEAA